MSKTRQFNINFTELVDKLTIDQIKEVFSTRKEAKKYALELKKIERDIDLQIRKKRIKFSAQFLRMILFLAQVNLHIWHNKDKMEKDSKKYIRLLKFSQDLNGIRNHIKNLMLEEAQETTPAAKKATFLEFKGRQWYAPILKSLQRKKK